MNVYFACSITGGRKDENVYQAIVAALLADGHTIPTAHLAHPGVVDLELVVDACEVYRRDIEWIETCETLVAEVSTPSHGVGYEIAYALSRGKPVLCTYREGTRISKMIAGNSHPDLHLAVYRSADEAAQIVRDFLRRKGEKPQDL